MAIFSSNSKRPRYFDRQQLSAADLTLEQDYANERSRQLNRHLHGWGVVCGAFVQLHDINTASLSEGFAVTPLGDVLHIPPINSLQLLSQLELTGCCIDSSSNCEELSDAANPAQHINQLFLIARPALLLGEPRTGLPEHCAHPGNQPYYSRQCDAIDLQLVCELPPLHQPAPNNCALLRQLFCQQQRVTSLTSLLQTLQSCPGEISSEQNYVVLATIQLDEPNPTAVIPRRIIAVSYSERRLLLPQQLLQQYFSCLCEVPQPTATPTFTVSPTPTFTFRPTATATFTVSPTVTATFRPTATATFTFNPTATFTAFPSVTPSFTFRPGDNLGALTRPVDQILPGVDVLIYDVVKGARTSIDELVLINDARKSRLHRIGVNSLVDLYNADSSQLAAELAISEVQVAEFKDSALESMQRATPLALDQTEYDVVKGMVAPVEEVHNIGRTRGNTLRANGYASLADVANTNPAALSKLLLVSERVATELIGDARQKLRLT